MITSEPTLTSTIISTSFDWMLSRFHPNIDDTSNNEEGTDLDLILPSRSPPSPVVFESYQEGRHLTTKYTKDTKKF